VGRFDPNFEINGNFRNGRLEVYRACAEYNFRRRPVRERIPADPEAIAGSLVVTQYGGAERVWAVPGR
jgi:hypothetical protein